MTGPAPIGYPFNTGNSPGTGAQSSTAVPSPQPVWNSQGFSTTPVVNVRRAVYTLSIRSPDTSSAPVLTYTFPLSPSNLSKKAAAMATFYDVAGNAKQLGVQRIVDQYGQAPAMFTIEGTTGWQKHAMDGGSLTGLDSILAIQALLQQFAAYNAQQQINGAENLYKLYFYDYFSSDFWEVVPVGDQEISQDAQRPLLFRYLFRLVGITPLDASPPPGPPDPTATAFSTPPAQAQSSTATAVSGMIGNYAAQTPGSEAYAQQYMVFP